MRKLKFILLSLCIVGTMSCKQQYRIVQIHGEVIEMDSTWDKNSNEQMHNLVQKYKQRLDQEMGEVIGISSQLMDYDRPESLLTNLTSDVMKAYGDEQLEGGCDVAVMNVFGHRSILPIGQLTIRNLFEIYSFDNVIAFLELKGADLQRIFDAYAERGGAGISGNVRLVIQYEKVKNVTIDGKPIDEDKIYKIVTLDYLADGNDGMDAFRDAVKTDISSLTLRDLMIDYVKQQTLQGNEIVSKIDGRITIIK